MQVAIKLFYLLTLARARTHSDHLFIYLNTFCSSLTDCFVLTFRACAHEHFRLRRSAPAHTRMRRATSGPVGSAPAHAQTDPDISIANAVYCLANF
jgi:hypothetical protein